MKPKNKPTVKELLKRVEQLEQSFIQIYRYTIHCHEAIQAYDHELKQNHDKLIEKYAEHINKKTDIEEDNIESKDEDSKAKEGESNE